MPLDIEAELQDLKRRLTKQEQAAKLDSRVPLLATEFDVKDAIFPPAARVYNSGNISIPDSVSTALTYDSERFDNDDIHPASGNTGRLECKTAGLYLIITQVKWAEFSTTDRQTTIKLNNTTTIGAHASTGDSGNDEIRWQVATTMYELVVGDYVETVVYQNRGDAGTVNVLAAANYSPEFMMCRLGP